MKQPRAVVFCLGHIAYNHHIPAAVALSAGVNIQANVCDASTLHGQSRRFSLCDTAFDHDALAGRSAYADQAALYIGC